MKKKKKMQYNDIEPINTVDKSIFNNILVIKNVQTDQVLSNGVVVNGIPFFDPTEGQFRDIYANLISLEPEADTDSQKYVVYPLDSNLYLIVHIYPSTDSPTSFLLGYGVIGQYVLDQQQGNVVTNGITGYGFKTIPYVPSNYSLSNKMVLLLVQDNIFQIRDSLKGAYVVPNFQVPNDIYTHHSLGINGQNAIGFETLKTNNTNQQWEFKPIQPFPVITPPSQTPQTDIGPVPQYPEPTEEYVDIKNLPMETEKVFLGWTKIPAPMVNIDNTAISKKIEIAPYYVLERYGYWKYLENSSLAPGESIETINSYGATIETQKEITQETNITVDERLGLKFGLEQSGFSFGTTADLDQQITNDLKMDVSTTSNVMESCSETIRHYNQDPNTFLYTRYIKATDLVLKRPSRSEYDPDIIINTWTFTDGRTRIDSSISIPTQNTTPDDEL